MPGKLRQDVDDELWIWRPVVLGKVALEAVIDGRVSAEDIMKLNGLLDMQADIEAVELERQRNDRS